MKTWTDLLNRAKMEIAEWFPKQCRNPYARFFLYYMASTPEHNGGITIYREPPANPECVLASPKPIPRNLTQEQVLRHLEPILRRLPVLSSE